MTGLEKMITQILNEAESSARDQLEKANTEAKAIKDESKAKCDDVRKNMAEQSEQDYAAYIERIKSSADLRRRQALLQAKQEMITNIIDKAYASISSMETQEYFLLIQKMLEKYVTAQSGKIFLSKADLKRIPEGFEDLVKKIAGEKGGSLSISKTPAKIDNGFILVYGGIEENCSFKALFDSAHDNLQDKVHEYLFS